MYYWLACLSWNLNDEVEVGFRWRDKLEKLYPVRIIIYTELTTVLEKIQCHFFVLIVIFGSFKTRVHWQQKINVIVKIIPNLWTFLDFIPIVDHIVDKH